MRIFLTDYPHSCVTLYMYPLLLMSSVAVILDQHIKKSLQTLNGLGGLHYFCLGVTEQPTKAPFFYLVGLFQNCFLTRLLFS